MNNLSMHEIIEETKDKSLQTLLKQASYGDGSIFELLTELQLLLTKNGYTLTSYPVVGGSWAEKQLAVYTLSNEKPLKCINCKYYSDIISKIGKTKNCTAYKEILNFMNKLKSADILKDKQ